MDCSSSTSPTTTTLTLVRGDDQNLAVTVQNPDGTPYDLTDCTLTFTARVGTYFGEIVPTYPIVTTVHADPTAGLSQIAFTPENTINMGSDPYFFDIKLTSAADLISTLDYGALLIVPH